MLEVLNAAAIRQWSAVCVQSLNAHRDDINRINVYPVPDSDTGTNLLNTMRDGLEALLRAPADARRSAGSALGVLARGALAGAAGNSGVIMSQILRGMAESAVEVSELDGAALAEAFASGARRAAHAIAAPVDGTLISVMKVAADAASADSLSEVATTAATAAAKALEQTPLQLEALAEAGVVDAGALGLVLVLEALVTVVAEQRFAPKTLRPQPAPTLAPTQATDHGFTVTHREGGSDAFSYEVMYLLDRAQPSTVDTLRDALGGLGDCVSVAGDGDGDLWTVHVHTNDIGPAIEAGIEAGRPHKIRVARFADGPLEPASRFAKDRAVVVAVRGGLGDLFAQEGATVFTAPHDHADPYQLLEVITGTQAAQVTVLPGDAGLTAAADEAAIRAVASGQDVLVVPCSSPVQALAALAVHDVRRRAGDDVVGMAEAAAATRRGEVVVSQGEAITWIGPCHAGDVLGFADGEVVIIEQGPPGDNQMISTARGVARVMLSSGGELVTAVIGDGAPADLAAELSDFMRTEHPEADLVCYDGGKIDAVLLLGVE